MGKAGLLVLTVACEAQGPQQRTITCRNMGGSQVALLDLEEQQTVATLRNALAEQLQFHGTCALSVVMACCSTMQTVRPRYAPPLWQMGLPVAEVATHRCPRTSRPGCLRSWRI